MDAFDTALKAVIPDEAVRALFDGLVPRQPQIPLHKRKLPRMDPFLLPLNDAEWNSTFRFQRRHVRRLCDALRLPAVIRVEKGPTAPVEHAMLWLLYRYVGGHTYNNCHALFGPHRSTISKVIKYIESHIVRHCCIHLQNFHPSLTRASLERYAEALERKGCPIRNVWGFIDGIKWKITRPGGPGVLQRSVYSGYVKDHCLSLHAITSPDGIIQHLYGPRTGRQNDLNVLDESCIHEKMDAMPG